ncbi:glycosyl transferase family 1, partial [Thioclava sp. BHET1]
ACSRASPAFDGHAQPLLPGELGFYDLRQSAIMAEQASLARAAGIDAFCVYHYWFDGSRLLQAPMAALLNDPSIDFPFYLCWANESWRRNWDGLSGEVLMRQGYGAGFEAALAASLLPYLRDHRYQRPDGIRPRFVIYRPDDLPAPRRNIARMREAWRSLGLGEVEIGAVRFHLPQADPLPEDLVDFWIEMPPHGLVTPEAYRFGGPRGNELGPILSPRFQGLIYDYSAVIDRSLSDDYRTSLPRNTITGAMPSWDNSARRGMAAHIAYGANPGAFRRWLYGLARHRLATSYRQEFFLNAWNEWGERAVLEPDRHYGRAWIDTLADWRSDIARQGETASAIRIAAITGKDTT